MPFLDGIYTFKDMNWMTQDYKYYIFELFHLDKYVGRGYRD